MGVLTIRSWGYQRVHNENSRKLGLCLGPHLWTTSTTKESKRICAHLALRMWPVFAVSVVIETLVG